MTRYGNWFPKWIINTIFIGLIILLGLSGYLYINNYNIAFLITSIITILYILFTLKSYYMYISFNLDSKDSISWKIIKYVATFVEVEPYQTILDIGCGSGALSIECAKKYKHSIVVGMDKWGSEYNVFSKEICELNSKEENVSNTQFIKGDIKNLNLKKESYDCITSNYVIHNVPGNKQDMILDILELLKKGGTFAIHDIFNKSNYGEINQIIDKLNELGYEKIEFISTTEGFPMTKKEAKSLMLSGSKILYGIK